LAIFNRFSLKCLIFILEFHIIKLQLAESFLLLFAFSFAFTNLLIVLSVTLVKVTFLEMALPGLIVVLASHRLMMLFHLVNVHISLNSGLNRCIREIFGGDAFALPENTQVGVASSRLLY